MLAIKGGNKLVNRGRSKLAIQGRNKLLLEIGISGLFRVVVS